MKSFDHWRVRNEAKILNSEKKRIGNELPRNQAEAGGTYKISPKKFKGQLEEFKSKPSHKEPQPDGLGDKGMDGVGKATFDREPVKAGETPTISNGIPVGELKGQFEAFKTFKEFAPAQATPEPAVAMGQQDPTGQPTQPEMDTRGLPPAIMRYLDMSLKAAANLGPQKLRLLWSVMNKKMEQLIQQSSTSDSMARTMRNRQGLMTRKGI